MRGDCANHHWTGEELNNPVVPLCVAKQQVMGYVPLGFGDCGVREFARKARPGEVLRNINELRKTQKRVITLKKEKAALDAEVKDLESKVRLRQTEPRCKKCSR